MTLKEWFQKFTQREQVYLLAVGLVVLLYLLLVVLWQPLSHKRDEMAIRNVQVAEQLARVQALASELQQLKAGGGTRNKLNMNELINNSTNKYGIRPSRIQPNSRG
jgi:general secretion pathway protein M